MKGRNLNGVSAAAVYDRSHRVAVIGNGSSLSESTALHEIGHAFGQISGWNEDAELAKQWEEMLGHLPSFNYQDLNDVSRSIRETVAESFADYVMNGSRARERWGDGIIRRIASLYSSLT